MVYTMNLLEIVMLVIGLIIIIISCWKVKYPNNENDNISYNNNSKDDKQHIESISSVSEDIIAKTEDYLSKLSNEKIIAVSEYSDQILEKINRNHEEVVFLYNMLNHKEKELKEVLKEFNNSQRRVKIANNQEEKEHEADSPINTQLSDKLDYLNKDDQNINQSFSVNNETILNLYSQGKSVVEISKHLGIGQGEVKLVIDLFKDKQ